MTVGEFKKYIEQEQIRDDILIDDVINTLIIECKIKHYRKILNNIGNILELYQGKTFMDKCGK